PGRPSCKPAGDGRAPHPVAAGRPTLFLIFLDRQRQRGIDVPAVVARAMRELGVATLRAIDVMDGLERVMRTPLALASLAGLLNGKHETLLPSRQPGPRTLRAGGVTLGQINRCDEKTTAGENPPQ